jgi:hypothetical protein
LEIDTDPETAARLYKNGGSFKEHFYLKLIVNDSVVAESTKDALIIADSM